MNLRLILIGAFSAALGFGQIPNAPNTQPKPVNDPTNTGNITGDPTIPGTAGNITGSNPGIGSNPGAGTTLQTRQVADQTFATHLTLQDMTGIELAKMVSEKSSSDAVKSYAQHMTDSNKKMIGRLKRIAARGSVTIPGDLDAHHKSRVDKLAKLSGNDFDRAFAKDQVAAVERNLKSFQEEIQNGDDQNLKMLATRSAPELQKQLQEARDLEKSLKGKS